MRKKGIRAQILTEIFLFVVVPFLCMGMISFHMMEQALLKEGAHYSEKLMNWLTGSLDDYLVDMVGLSILPMYDEEVLSIMEDHDERLSVDENQKLKNFMFMLNNLRVEIEGVFIYCADGRIYENIAGKGSIGQYSYNHNYDYKNADWYQTAKQKIGKSVVIAPRLQEQVIPGEREVLSVGRIIQNLRTGKEMGAILIDVNFTQVERLCQNLIYDANEYVAIVDGSGNPIYTTAGQPGGDFDYGDILREMGERASIFYQAEGKKYLVTMGKQGYGDWKAMRIVSVDNVINEAVQLRKGFVLLFFLGLLLATVAVSIGIRRITEPIKIMCEKMSLVERGNLEVRVDVAESRELAILGRSFNIMVERLKESLHRAYQVELEKKQAQLMALQSQINPHFLYNTLDSIHMMAELNCDYEVGVMVTSLAKMLRYSIDTGGFEKGVQISDEVECVIHYMALQKIRLENQVDLEIRIPKELEHCIIPKLILQPLVENSVTHGLKGLNRVCRVTIEGRQEDGDVVLCIADNGAGMSEERLEHVRAALKDGEETLSKGSIGIRNVHHRIRFWFGGAYGIRNISADGTGTAVELCIPGKREKLGEAYVQHDDCGR